MFIIEIIGIGLWVIDVDNGLVFNDADKAIEYLKSSSYPAVIKADGLALGKGVIIAKDFNEAESAVKEIMLDKVFGASGNSILIEEFLNYLSAENKSEETLKVYRSNLNIFFVWYEENCKVKGQSKHFGKIKARDIVNFQSYMVKQGLSSSRIKNIKSSNWRNN